jgi:predicted deacylase
VNNLSKNLQKNKVLNRKKLCYLIQQEKVKGPFWMEVLIDHGNELNSQELIDQLIDYLAEEQR